MIHIFLNGLSASAGGGLTYVRNVVPQLAERPDVRATVLVPASLRTELGQWRSVVFPETHSPSTAIRRVCWEQKNLPRLIRESGAEVLLSAGNFALWASRVPQILLSRNALYTSGEFHRDLLRRREYALWFDTKVKGTLAKHSIRRADITVAPSAAFAEELTRWTGRRVEAIHHGFDAERFCSGTEPLPAEIQRKLEAAPSTLRLLFVSHYNYYRNFETLFQALPILKEKLGRGEIKLFLTCRLGSAEEPGAYKGMAARDLVTNLGLTETVVELGPIPYRLLHWVYRACDIYVTPAYAETFAHPLVEAMSCGVPIVASDLAVHREICGDAAAYCPAFQPDAFATTIAEVALSEARRQTMSAKGRGRATQFSWARHVDEVLELAEKLKNASLTRIGCPLHS